MWGFFNKQNYWCASTQAFNIASITIATYNLITNPEASFSELGMDIVIHATSILSLRENTDTLAELCTVGLNIAGLGAIYAGVTSGCTSMSGAMAAINAVNYVLNTGALLLSSASVESNNEITSYAKK